MSKLSEEQLLERLQEEKKANAEKAERKQQAIADVESYLNDMEVYYVTKDGKYWKFIEDSNEWVFNTADAMRQSDYRIRPAEKWEQFLQVMQRSGRVKETKTYSFTERPKSVLNMMRKDGWLTPRPGRTENTVFFDYLMTAISGSTEENARHIKQVVGWKYLHPETWQLPCLAFYGSGGSGKNLFAEKILSIIFAPQNCVKLKFDQIARFNEPIAGKTIVYIDERPSRDDESQLKFIVGSPSLPIEGKGQAVYKVDNTALYILGTDSSGGPVRIEQNGSQRRWSLLKVKETLVKVVMRMEGLDQATATERIKWADEHVYSNPDEVAHFLNECIEEAKKLDAFPPALHGEDYDELVQSQRDVTDDLLNDIFVEFQKFEDITLPALYAVYVERNRAANPGATPMSQNKLLVRAMDFILHNELSEKVKRTSKRVNVKQGGVFTGKAQAFYNASVFAIEPSSMTDKTTFYMSGGFLAETKGEAKVVQLAHAMKAFS